MRHIIAGVLVALSFSATARAANQLPIANLQYIFDHPLASNRRAFDGVAYLYLGATAYYLFPKKVTDAEFEAANIDIMPGAGSDMEKLSQHKSGDRLRLRAYIDVDLPCFTGNICSPFRKPIFLNHMKIVH